MKNRYLLTILLSSLTYPLMAAEDTNVTNKLKDVYRIVHFHTDKSGMEYYEIADKEFNRGIADSRGEILVPVRYDYISIKHFPDNQDTLYEVSNANKQEALLSKEKKMLIPFSRGYTFFAPECIEYDGKKYRYICVNKSSGTNGLNENGHGICNMQGKEILPPTYPNLIPAVGLDIGPYLSMLNRQDNKWGLFSIKWERLLLPCAYDMVSYYNEIYWTGAFGIKGDYKTIKYEVYNKNGKICDADHIYTPYLKNISDPHIIYFEKNQLFGYIDTKIGKVIAPAQYTSVEFFDKGVAMVCKDGTSYLITKESLYKGGDALKSLSIETASKSDVDTNIPQGKGERENTFVVIFANEVYDDFVVPSAKNDGEIFKEYCLRTLAVPKTNIIYYENATINNMHAAVKRIQDLAEVYEDGCKVIFYYSGQGITDDATKEKYLFPSDGTTNAIKSTCYSLTTLYADIGNIPNAEQLVFLIDAPFNGYSRENKPLQSSRGVALKANKSHVLGKTIAMEAASEGETAYIYKEQNHGLFTYFLLKTLQKNKGEISLQQLSDEIYKQVKEYSTKRLKSVQSPQITNSIDINTIEL